MDEFISIVGDSGISLQINEKQSKKSIRIYKISAKETANLI